MTKAAFFLTFIVLSVNVFSQTTTDTTTYTKTPDGSEYKIFASASGAKLVTGNFMELNVVAKYKDSVLYSSYEEAMPQFALYDTAMFPVPFKDIFKKISTGDSIVLRMPTDSLIVRGQSAPFIAAGQYIYQYYTVANFYTSQGQVDSAQQTHAALAGEILRKRQLAQIEQMLVANAPKIASDSKIIEAYLAKNNIKAIKAKLGTYVVIKKQGTGNKLAPGYTAAINYTCKSFSSNKVFDSNTDPKFKHVTPYDVNMGQLNAVILGWTDAFTEMQKGTKATIYVPSTLAYGAQGKMPDIKPDEILTFDIEVKDAGTELEMMVKAQAAANKTPALTKPVVNKKITPTTKTKVIAKPKTTIKKAGK